MVHAGAIALLAVPSLSFGWSFARDELGALQDVGLELLSPEVMRSP